MHNATKQNSARKISTNNLVGSWLLSIVTMYCSSLGSHGVPYSSGIHQEWRTIRNSPKWPAPQQPMCTVPATCIWGWIWAAEGQKAFLECSLVGSGGRCQGPKTWFICWPPGQVENRDDQQKKSTANNKQKQRTTRPYKSVVSSI